MLTSEHFGLFLPEGGDPLSAGPFHENFKTLDGEMAARGKLCGGSWEGGTACQSPANYSDFNGKKFTRGFGQPNSAASDVVITLDFEPKRLMVWAYREADISWSVTTGSTYYTENGDLTAYNVSTNTREGKEYQAVCLEAPAGQSVVPGKLYSRYPVISNVAGYGSTTTTSFGWSVENSEPWFRVEFGTTGDGKYTVTIKGANADYGTENYADIEGMTYHWVAFG